MGLSCSCDFEPDVGDWFWESNQKLKPMKKSPRRKRCCSCATLIDEGDNAVEFHRFKVNEDGSVVEAIHGEAKPLASWFECEGCTDLREALEEHGYCVNLGDFMAELVQEHHEMKQYEREFL